MLIAYEDQHFAEHDGIDWPAMLRAAGQFVGAGGHIVSGGSTLTMQVARLIEGEPTRNLAGKLRQMVHADGARAAAQQGRRSSTLYLTLAPYGGNIEGIRAASLAYFGKEPARLTTAEAALLVALPQSPEARRPDRDPDGRARRPRPACSTAWSARASSPPRRPTPPSASRCPTARRDFPMLAAHLAEQAVAAQPDAPRRSS